MATNGHQMGVRSKEEANVGVKISATVAGSVGTLLAVAIVGFVIAAPFAWLLMLFFGNLGLTSIGFWGCLPGGGLFGVLVAAGRAPR